MAAGPTAKVEIVGLDEFVADMRAAPAEIDKRLEDLTEMFAKDIASGARSRGSAGSAQLAAGSSTIRAVGSVINVGGSSVVASGGGTAGDLFFGANFGSRNYPQFPSAVKPDRTLYAEVDSLRATMDDKTLDLFEDIWRG